MVFKRMLGAFGVGGPSVDAVLSNPNTRPGLTLAGQVDLAGGNFDTEIEQVTVGLVTRVEIEGGEQEETAGVEFHQVYVAGALRLAADQQLSLPFQVELPWETPITHFYGQPLAGMTLGLRTSVSARGAADPGDLDPVAVHPLPVQERILEAFGTLGFQFVGADLEYGQLAGLAQTLPFYQEIEYVAPPQYPGVRQAELTFLADPYGVTVVLEFDKQAGLFTPGHDSYGHYRVAHDDADRLDWTSHVDGWIRQALDQRQALLGGGYPAPGYGAPAGYGAPGPYGHGHHQEHEGRGPGMGGVIAGAVGGAALGFGAGMLAEQAFDAFGDDDSAVAEGDEEELDEE
ncbi:sporulation protein [Solwaraspora sp. WMMA2101]|uniref:sporulation protein n=1 Tax=Solwaraspora sp. WMMA2101 TaxID=3404124 RepID=UPI003B93FC43